MRTFGFGEDLGRHISHYGSDFVMSRLARTEGIHVGCMRLGPGGLVGYHRASTPQLFAVVEGSGWVRGEGPERIPIQAGQAVYWEQGEQHESGTDKGMVAIVIEGDVLSTNPMGIGPAPPPTSEG